MKLTTSIIKVITIVMIIPFETITAHRFLDIEGVPARLQVLGRSRDCKERLLGVTYAYWLLVGSKAIWYIGIV